MSILVKNYKSFWRENSNVVEISPKNLTFKKIPPLQSRSNCIAANKLCPGISAGCGLCGLFSPATCGDQCIVAGIYCGVSAFACKAEQKVKNKKKRPYGGRAQRLSSKYLQNFYA